MEMADESYCLGPAPSAQSYLNMDRILEVIKESGAEAVMSRQDIKRFF